MNLPTDGLEARLTRILEFSLSADLAQRIDDQVARAAAAPAARRGWFAPPRSIRRSALLGLAASVIVVGIAVASLTGLERVVRGSPTGWQLAWEQATVVDRSVDTGDGVLTVERAYADANVVLIGMSRTAHGLASGPPGSVSGVEDVTLADSKGRAYRATIGLGNADVELSEWLPPGPLPAEDLHLTLAGSGANGPWAIEFVVPATGGTLVRPGVTATANGLTLTLSEVRISQTTVRADIRVDRADSGTDWSPVTWTYLRDGAVVDELSATSVLQQAAGAHALFTTSGTGSPNGGWELRVDEMSGLDAGGVDRRIHGPWTFAFQVP